MSREATVAAAVNWPPVGSAWSPLPAPLPRLRLCKRPPEPRRWHPQTEGSGCAQERGLGGKGPRAPLLGGDTQGRTESPWGTLWDQEDGSRSPLTAQLSPPISPAAPSSDRDGSGPDSEQRRSQRKGPVTDRPIV